MPTYRIRHATSYRYRSAVAFGEHRMMLRPRESADQRTLSAEIEIAPGPAEMRWSEDASGNLVGTCRFARRARELRFDATIEVEQTELGPEAIHLADHAATLPFSYGADEMPDLARFIERQVADPDHAVDAFARAVLSGVPDRGTAAFLARLAAAIRRDLAYLRREEAGIQTPARTLKLGRGTCRDFAVLMAEAARSLGLAARFVSGYLFVRPDDHAAARTGGHTHAWLQVFLPGAGWIDFDPTSGGVGNRHLVRVAAVRDPGQASPLSGSFLGFPKDYLGMEVSVEVSLASTARSGLPPATLRPAAA